MISGKGRTHRRSGGQQQEGGGCGEAEDHRQVGKDGVFVRWSEDRKECGESRRLERDLLYVT